ncbi:uncharacterized protein PRCAT00004832001 [Priceomyces carsonii]|uniref:uncharacterized protein n=1 Tax=Priceomyces carsonii TaxID=28549 RepID=UPI002ED91004|nr:unnamed protein product [Priceomyces carsonii]
MTVTTSTKKAFYPQALSTGLSVRIAKDPDNSLIVTSGPTGRSAKRNTQQINYAEFDNYNDDLEFEENPSSSKSIAASLNNQLAPNSQKLMLKPVRATPQLKNITELLNSSDLAHRSDQLIPIKISLDYNGGNSKLVDFFMWNLNELVITPGQFGTILCNDLELPSSLEPEIAESITKQVEDYNYVSSLQLPQNMEFHVIIDLAVNLNKKLYEDRFEWDLAQNLVTPEDFANIVVADMGLSLEFKPAISHSLHEVILRLKKEISEGTYNHELHKYQQLGGLIFESGIRITTEGSIHNGTDQWEPIVEILTPWEIEKREIERERNIRRLKRENMKREVDDYGPNKRRAHKRRHDDLDW